ncbi:hypothetical protein P078_0066 [Lactococcus phage P078]|uniref:Uncharacterized protein n=1 Tax=Lactococcus phage P078 TaxID=1476886 RepID=X4YWB1_9CAUD|nr:hypothetical protein GJ21_gp66 [Lactococcus phage P078]AHV83029.1 hypothetical protein P078_0066 [Lactococcus phage P078]
MVRLENFNNFEEYCDAKQRWVKNPNDTNAGYLLALSQSLLNQVFIAQREEEEKEEEKEDEVALKEKENQKVVDTDADEYVHITIDEYFEWLNTIKDICKSSLERFESRHLMYKSGNPSVTLSAYGLKNREIPTQIMLEMIELELKIIDVARQPFRTWRDSRDREFKFAFQLRIANPALIESAEYARDHKKEKEDEK